MRGAHRWHADDRQARYAAIYQAQWRRVRQVNMRDADVHCSVRGKVMLRLAAKTAVEDFDAHETPSAPPTLRAMSNIRLRVLIFATPDFPGSMLVCALRLYAPVPPAP